MAAFELTDDGGHVFTDKQLRGRTSLVFFGFTHCRNVCPPTLQNLRRVSRSLAEQKLPVSVVMISVDGDRDTPPVMKSYLQPYMPGFIGVTGKPDDVSRLAAGFSAVFFRGMPTDAQGGYDVEHTSQVYLVDAKGRLRVTFYNAPTGEIEEAARLVQKE